MSAGRRIAGSALALALAAGAPAQDRDSGLAFVAPDRVPIYFPPNPPPLGRPVPHALPEAAGAFGAPPLLAAFVNEVFYPALGTRLSTGDLPAKLQQRVADYRVARDAQRQELRTALDRVGPLDAAAREPELAAFARTQTPRLAQLELTADQLRRDLMTGDRGWGDLREWRLGQDDGRGFSPFEVAQVMLGYAFYDTLLLPAQRRLLREIALEMFNAGETQQQAAAQQPYIFLGPEPARVLLPARLPADLAAKVSAFQTRKAELKKRLYDAVAAREAARLILLRGNPLKAAASQEADGIAALDTMAEEIRRALARMPDDARAENAPLPADLMRRAGAFNTALTALQRATGAKADAVLGQAREFPVQAAYRFDPDAFRFVILPARGFRPADDTGSDYGQTVEQLRKALAAIAADYARQIAELLAERDTLRADIAQALGHATPLVADDALNAALRFAAIRATDDAYRLYRLAVFQPGLSPEQRRLLFGDALERLDLPLPRGELQPVQRSSSW